MIVELDKILKETANINHVYALQYGPYVKFGVTKQLLQRFNNIYTDMVLPRQWLLPLELQNMSLHLNSYCVGDQYTESLIHAKFKHKNVKFGFGNEWFEIDKGVELFINLMTLYRLAGLEIEKYLINYKVPGDLGNKARLLWLQQHPDPQDHVALHGWILKNDG